MGVMKQGTLFRLVAFAVIGSGLSVAVCHAGSLQEVSFDVVRNGIVHIGEQTREGIPRWLGTGFLVDERCTFATAKHVLVGTAGDRNRLVVRFQSPKDLSKVITVLVSVLHEDPESDLAFLRVRTVNNRPCSSGGLYVFRLASDAPTSAVIGAPVVIIGHPVLAENDKLDIPVLRKGHLSSVEIQIQPGRNALLLDLLGVPGFSGSPVILEQTGEVIGVIFGPGPTRRGAGFEWATPITRRHYETAAETKSK